MPEICSIKCPKVMLAFTTPLFLFVHHDFSVLFFGLFCFFPFEVLKALILPVWKKEHEVVFVIGVFPLVSCWLRSGFIFS